MDGANPYQFASNITEWIDPLGLVKSSQSGGLNWNWKGVGDRLAHIIDNHGSVNPNKPKQVSSNKNLFQQLTRHGKRMKKNRCPDSSDNDTDTYNVEMNQPIGYDRDTGAILTKVKIIVMKGTNKIITGYPS